MRLECVCICISDLEMFSCACFAWGGSNVFHFFRCRCRRHSTLECVSWRIWQWWMFRRHLVCSLRARLYRTALSCFWWDEKTTTAPAFTRERVVRLQMTPLLYSLRSLVWHMRALIMWAFIVRVCCRRRFDMSHSCPTPPTPSIPSNSRAEYLTLSRVQKNQ